MVPGLNNEGCQATKNGVLEQLAFLAVENLCQSADITRESAV